MFAHVKFIIISLLTTGCLGSTTLSTIPVIHLPSDIPGSSTFDAPYSGDIRAGITLVAIFSCLK